MTSELDCILDHVRGERALDFSAYRRSMIERRIRNRMSTVGRGTLGEYLRYLKENPGELIDLIDALTINVSRFFRETLTFEYIADRVLPSIFTRKQKGCDAPLRIWSVGCANGEEPYSVAMLVHELLGKEDLRFDLHFFATDIDEGALRRARDGVYGFDSVKNMKYRLLKKHFTRVGESYLLKPEIRKIVNFSNHDILDRNTYAPPESVFGHFDLVLCRNLLIYFQEDCQKMVFDKLYRALDVSGYLVLGEVEALPARYEKLFERENECCRIFVKCH